MNKQDNKWVQVSLAMGSDSQMENVHRARRITNVDGVGPKALLQEWDGPQFLI